MIRLTTKEERELLLAVASLSFASLLKGANRADAMAEAMKLVANILWVEAFDRTYATHCKAVFGGEDGLTEALQATVENLTGIEVNLRRKAR